MVYNAPILHSTALRGGATGQLTVCVCPTYLHDGGPGATSGSCPLRMCHRFYFLTNDNNTSKQANKHAKYKYGETRQRLDMGGLQRRMQHWLRALGIRLKCARKKDGSCQPGSVRVVFSQTKREVDRDKSHIARTCSVLASAVLAADGQSVDPARLIQNNKTVRELWSRCFPLKEVISYDITLLGTNRRLENDKLNSADFLDLAGVSEDY